MILKTPFLAGLFIKEREREGIIGFMQTSVLHQNHKRENVMCRELSWLYSPIILISANLFHYYVLVKMY